MKLPLGVRITVLLFAATLAYASPSFAQDIPPVTEQTENVVSQIKDSQQKDLNDLKQKVSTSETEIKRLQNELTEKLRLLGESSNNSAATLQTIKDSLGLQSKQIEELKKVNQARDSYRFATAENQYNANTEVLYSVIDKLETLDFADKYKAASDSFAAMGNIENYSEFATWFGNHKNQLPPTDQVENSYFANPWMNMGYSLLSLIIRGKKGNDAKNEFSRVSKPLNISTKVKADREALYIREQALRGQLNVVKDAAISTFEEHTSLTGPVVTYSSYKNEYVMRKTLLEKQSKEKLADKVDIATREQLEKKIKLETEKIRSLVSNYEQLINGYDLLIAESRTIANLRGEEFGMNTQTSTGVTFQKVIGDYGVARTKLNEAYKVKVRTLYDLLALPTF